MRLTDARKKEIAFARKLGAQGQRQLNAIVKDARGTGKVLTKTLNAGKADLTNVISIELQATYIGHAGNVLAEPSMNISAADWELVNERAATWSNKYSVQQVKGMDTRTQRKVQNVLGELRDAAKEIGEPIPEFFTRQTTLGTVRSQLQPVFGAVRSELIASTELTRAAYQGELAVIERVRANGFAMLGKWATSTDERTCPICDGLNNSVLSSERQDNIGLDGSVTSSVRGDPKAGTWNLTGIFRGKQQTLKIPGPPAHPRCRCWVNYELQTIPLKPKPQRRRTPAKKPLPPVSVPNPNIPTAEQSRKRIIKVGEQYDEDWAALEKTRSEVYKKGEELKRQHYTASDALFDDILTGAAEAGAPPTPTMRRLLSEIEDTKKEQAAIMKQQVELKATQHEKVREILSEGKRPSKITRNFETFDDILEQDVMLMKYKGTQDKLYNNLTGAELKAELKVMEGRSEAGAKWLEDVTDGIEKDINFSYRADRAKFSPPENKVYIDSTSKSHQQAGTSVHEIAHGLETMPEGLGTDGWFGNGLDFYKKRTIDPETGIQEPLVMLRDVMKNKNYRTSELTRCDKFWDCYVGKEYLGDWEGLDGFRRGASEIYSMGLQELYDDAVGFAIKDPDYFDFIVDSLIGKGHGRIT